MHGTKAMQTGKNLSNGLTEMDVHTYLALYGGLQRVASRLAGFLGFINWSLSFEDFCLACMGRCLGV